MNGEITEIIIVSIVVIIIYIIMDFKIKNFIPEIYKNILSIIFYFFLIVDVNSSNGIIDEVYDSFVMLLIPIAIIGTYTILKKNIIYYFKGIDKDFIKRNINELSQIINDYKNNNLDDKSEITLINSRIIFEKVSQPHLEECLSLVGNYLDENREKYTIKDYMTYYIRTVVLPITIVLAITFILLKLFKTTSF